MSYKNSLLFIIDIIFYYFLPHLQNFTLCLLTSILLGFIAAKVHQKTTTNTTNNFMTTLMILPTLVSVVILMVNGNLGTSVAVLGAFSLVRFRSIPGNSREILDIFFTMAIGLAIGCGYLVFAVLFTLFVSIALLLIKNTSLIKEEKNVKMLKIVIPDDVDFEEEFDSIFTKYLQKKELNQIKTINMGQLFELNYTIHEKDGINEKDFMDELRIINSNLKITISNLQTNKEVL